MILGILQARCSSKRLPEKVLKPILGKPMILRQIERLQRAKQLSKVMLATSNHEDDKKLAHVCRQNEVPVFRGNLDDVLDRFYQASIMLPERASHLVRLTGDCPLADPHLIDQIITFHLKGNFDYSSNTLEPTFPDGLDVEIFTFKSLEEAQAKAKLKKEREHVTPYIYRNPEHFKLGSFKQAIDLSHLRWTVDEADDFELVSQIYQALYPTKPGFNTADILHWLDAHPQYKTFNLSHKRNESFHNS